MLWGPQHCSPWAGSRAAPALSTGRAQLWLCFLSPSFLFWWGVLSQELLDGVQDALLNFR